MGTPRLRTRWISPLRRRPKGFAIALWKPSPDRLFHLYDDQRWLVAAALSAAVTSSQTKERTRPFRRRQVSKNPKPIPSRSSGGSAREGKDSHSRQWRLSMAVFLNRNKRPSAAPIEVAELLSEKPPPSQHPPPLLHKLMVNGADGGLEVFVVYADDDGKLAGALINHANVDAGAGHRRKQPSGSTAVVYHASTEPSLSATCRRESSACPAPPLP